MSELYKRHPNAKCVVCAKSMYRRPGELFNNKGKVYCSQKCYGAACRKELPCAICEKPILAGANKKTCSRVCANVYREGIKYRIGRPKDKFLRFRNIKSHLTKIRGPYCEKCRFSKAEILVIHHKDRNRSNNGLDNLELICPNCHAEHHFLEKKQRRLAKLGEVA